MVGEVFEAQGQGVKAGKTIIHIQDAHCNYEAQMNMVKILESLIKNQGLRLILVEGGSGDVSLTPLRLYADEDKRNEVAQDYLQKGKISGEEYLDITSDYDIELFGVEQQELYDRNMEVFTDIEGGRADCLEYLDKVNEVIQALTPRMYNPRLGAFESRIAQLRQKSDSLSDYYAFLETSALEAKVKTEQYPHMANLFESAAIEKKLDLTQAETQRNAFLGALSKRLNEQEARELIRMTQVFKSQGITQQEYLSFLLDLAQKKISVKEEYPQFYIFARYETLGKEIDPNAILQEAALLEDAIRQTLFVDNNERRLCEIDRSRRFLVKLFNLELSPEEQEVFARHTQDLATTAWDNFLSDSCRRYNLSIRPPVSGVVDAKLSRMEDFYNIGREREKAFFDNIVKKMDKSDESLAVFISGGFHTPGLSRMLRDARISYAVVTPRVTQKGDSSLYFSVLRGDAYQDEYEETED
jgi:hypothetical protein